jgi:1-pyrroline-5-carboxylate dehydrogenase
MTNKLTIGDPTDKAVWLGPVINQGSYEDYKNFTEELSQAGKILTGGKVLLEGEMGKGFFCAPTLVADLPINHRLWKHEMFLPSPLSPGEGLDSAMQLASGVIRTDRRLLRQPG